MKKRWYVVRLSVIAAGITMLCEVSARALPLPSLESTVKAPYFTSYEKGICIPVLTAKAIANIKNEEVSPVTFAGCALERFNEYKSTGDKEARNDFLAGADKLLEVMSTERTDDGSEMALWPYNFPWPYGNYSFKAPWYSAMAQGMIVSTMLRAHYISGAAKYSRAAESAANSLLKASSHKKDFIYTDTSSELWLEEYPPFFWPDGRVEPSQVINGGLLAAYGLLEYETYVGRRSGATDRLMRWLENHVARYDLAPQAPSYDLLDRSRMWHFVNFETDVDDQRKDLLPVYAVALRTSGGKMLRSMRTTGGSANYEYTTFAKDTTLDVFFVSDGSYPASSLPFAEVALATEPGQSASSFGRTVFDAEWPSSGSFRGMPVHFYKPLGDWLSPPYRQRCYVTLDRAIPDAGRLYLKIRYFDAAAYPVSIFLYTEHRYNVGVLHNSGSGRWKTEYVYIPRAHEFSDYNLYLNFGDVKTYDGRVSQGLDLRKSTSSWDGNHLKFRLDEADAAGLKQAATYYLDITYKDNANNVVFVNIFNGNNNTLGLLSSNNDGRWKTESFPVPGWLLTRNSSHSEKTSTTIEALREFMKYYELPVSSDYCSRWEKSLFLMSHSVGMAYTQANAAPLSVKLSIRSRPADEQGRILYPSVSVISQDSWSGSLAQGATLSLGKTGLAYFTLPIVPGQKRYIVEITYEDQPARGKLFLGYKSQQRNQLYRLAVLEFHGTGKAKTVTGEYSLE